MEQETKLHEHIKQGRLNILGSPHHKLCQTLASASLHCHWNRQLQPVLAKIIFCLHEHNEGWVCYNFPCNCSEKCLFLGLAKILILSTSVFFPRKMLHCISWNHASLQESSRWKLGEKCFLPQRTTNALQTSWEPSQQTTSFSFWPTKSCSPLWFAGPLNEAAATADIICTARAWSDKHQSLHCITQHNCAILTFTMKLVQSQLWFGVFHFLKRDLS